MGMSSNHLNLDQLEPETPPNQEQEKKAKNRRQQQIIIRMPVLKLHRIGKLSSSGADHSCGREAGLTESA